MSSYEQKMKAHTGGVTPQGLDEDFSDLDAYKNIPDKLEDIEEQIVNLYSKTIECGWEIGKRLIKIRNDFLSQTGYENIADYAWDKYEIRKNTTYNLIFIAENYNRVQVLGLGSKLYPLRRIKDDVKREEIFNWMQSESPSYSQIEERISKELNDAQPKDPTPEVLPPEDYISFNDDTIQIDTKKLGLKIKKTDKTDFLEMMKRIVQDWNNGKGRDNLIFNLHDLGINLSTKNKHHLENEVKELLKQLAEKYSKKNND